MIRNKTTTPTTTAVRIVVIYSIVGCLWILFSDRLLELMVKDNHQLIRIAMFKGWAYVGLTAVLLYLLIRRYVDRLMAMDQELRLNRVTIEKSADEVFWTDEHGRFIYANPTATLAVGYTIEELRSMSVHDLAPSFPADQWPEHWQELKKKGTLTFESIQRSKNGLLTDIEVSTSYIRYGEQEYTAAFVRDISRRKQIQAALLAAESRFRDLLETVNLAAVMLDQECRITFCNDFLLGLTGWTQNEIIGRNWFDVFIPEEERSGVQAVNASMQADNIVPHFENHILTKSGDRRLVYWNNTVLRDPEGLIVGTASIGVDVTEHRLLEQNRRQLEQQMLQAQKLESLEILAGGIAHDFNNILAVIMGNAELAMKQLENRESVEKYLVRIQAASTKAAGLARQMLAYSGKGIFSVAPLNLSGLIDEMRNMLDVSLSGNITLKLNLDSHLPMIKGDASQLRQVVTNLVSNAAEAIGENHGVIAVSTVCIECDAEYLRTICPSMQLPAGRYICLDVTDTGCGMDEDTISRIFDPFFTTKFTGRGLGMAAVLGIVRGHGGAICVSSKPEKGSTLRVLLPTSDSPHEIRPVT